VIAQITAPIIIGTALLSGMAAQPSSPRLSPIPQKAITEGEAYTATGQIRPADNAHWCLTADSSTGNNTPLYVLPCIKGSSLQTWFMYRIPQSGGINLEAYPDAIVGQRGSSHNAVIINNGPNPTPSNTTTLVYFTPYEKGWLLDVKKGKLLWFLTIPSHLVARKMYTVQWSSVTSNNKKSVEWLLPDWQDLDTEPVVPGAGKTK